MSKCPRCGFGAEQFETTAPATPRLVSAESDVVVPLLQAAISAALIVMLGVVLLFVPAPIRVAGYALWFKWPLAALLALFLGGWLYLMRGARPTAPIGDKPPAPAPVRTQLEVRLRAPGRGPQDLFLEFDVEPDKLAMLFDGLLAGRLAESAWPGHREEFKRIRTRLLEAGLLRWKNPTTPARGCELTPAGRAVLRTWLDTRTHTHAQGGPGCDEGEEERGR